MGTQLAAEYFTLELGMPMLGRAGLNENALLKLIGHDRWETLSRLGGVRTSQIRDSFDNRLYATYCYVELALAPDRPLSAYDENDSLNFDRGDLCHYSRVYLDGKYVLADGGPFEIRCTNVFIYQLAGPQQLKMAQPDNMNFDGLRELPEQPDSLGLCRAAKNAGTFHTEDFDGVDLGTRQVTYIIDPDRDANGAGLIYFANFVCFLDYAERALLADCQLPADLVEARSTYMRKLGYFGNAQVTDQLQIQISAQAAVFKDSHLLLSFDYRINRASDGKMILVSSSRKSAKLDDAGREWFNALKIKSQGTTRG